MRKIIQIAVIVSLVILANACKKDVAPSNDAPQDKFVRLVVENIDGQEDPSLVTTINY